MPILKPVHTLDGRIEHVDPERADRFESTLAVRIDIDPFYKMVGERVGRHPWGVSVYRDGDFWFAHLTTSGFDQGPGYWFELTAAEVAAWRQAVRAEGPAEGEVERGGPAALRAARDDLIERLGRAGKPHREIAKEASERFTALRPIGEGRVRAILADREVPKRYKRRG